MYKILIILIISYSFLFSNDLLIQDENISFKKFEMEVFEDTSASLEFEAVKNAKFTQESNKVSYGFSKSNFWFRFTIKNETHNSVNYFIQSKEITSHEIDCYIISEDTSITKLEQGANRSSDKGLIEIKRPEFEITLKPKEKKEIYIRQYTLYPFFTAFYVLNEEEKKKDNLRDTIVISAYLGAIGALILYNLFIFFYTRDKSYFLYVLYVSAFAAWQAQTHGIVPFDTFSSTQMFYMTGILIPLWISFVILFSLSILNTKEIFPRIDLGLKYFVALMVFLGFYSWYDLQLAFLFINIIAIFVLPFLLYLGVRTYFTGHKVAIFYIIAISTFLSMSTLFTLMTYGYIEYSNLTRHGIAFGSIVEIFLFSLALGYRLKVLESEKLDIIKDAKKELELTVNKRTKELQAVNSELEKLMITDKLTSIFNRHGLDMMFADALSRYKRYQNSFGIILIDIDKFKNINDRYGHQQGDVVLKSVAKVLKSTTRASDIVGRWGGEEFLIICPEVSKETLLYLSENLRKSVENYKFNEVDVVTISLGIAIVSEDDTYDTIILKADKALYRAKNTGRNKVCS